MKTGKWDAFGAAAMAYLNRSGSEKIEITLPSDSDPPGVEPDWEDMSQYFQSYEDFYPEYYKEVLKYARGRVLDVGCGAGGFLLYLQRCALGVVGIDESPLALEVCRKRGAQDVRLMDAWALDVAQLGQFGAILLLGYNLGIGGTPDGVRELLASLLRLTREGGHLLLNSIDKELVPEDWARQQVAYSRTVGRYAGQTRYRVVFGEYETDWFDWIHVSPSDLKVWAEPLGWPLTYVAWGKPGYWAGVLEKTT